MRRRPQQVLNSQGRPTVRSPPTMAIDVIAASGGDKQRSSLNSSRNSVDLQVSGHFKHRPKHELHHCNCTKTAARLPDAYDASVAKVQVSDPIPV